MSRAPRPRWLVLAAVGAVALVAYLPSFWVPFQFDDYGRIGENAPLIAGDYLQALQWLGNSRIIPSASLVANYLVGGFEPLGYHVVNLLIHLLAALGVYQLVIELCRTPRLRGRASAARATTIAAAAALVFAIHPLQTQAVTYIIQRYASMAALFYVWSDVCYVRGRLRRARLVPGRPRPWYAAAALLALCAVLSKENAASLPLAIVLTEWVFFGIGWSRRTLLRGAGVIVVLLALPLVWKLATWRPFIPRPEGYTWTERLSMILQFDTSGVTAISPLHYLLTQFTVIPRYLGLVLLPWGLNVDHDVPVATGLSPAVLGGFALVVLLLVVGFATARRWPMVGYGILWIFVALSVESSLLPISDLMMEHRMYLAMPGVALLAATAFAAALEVARWPAIVAGTALGLALVSLTFARNVVWQSALTLWADAVEKSPDKARVHVNVGVAEHGVNHLDDAVRHYCRALRLDPEIALARDNLEIALQALGKFDGIEAHVVGDATGVGGDPNGVVVEVDVAETYCPE